MRFGLIIVGDEILSGKRRDAHLPKVIELLGARGLALAWARYVGDDRFVDVPVKGLVDKAYLAERAKLIVSEKSMGRALPNRVNWVITRDADWAFSGAKVAHSIEEALTQAAADVLASEKPESIFIIGGGEIFAQTMDIADRLELTYVELDVQGDAHYPAIPDSFKKVASEQHIDDKTGIAFEFATYRK